MAPWLRYRRPQRHLVQAQVTQQRSYDSGWYHRRPSDSRCELGWSVDRAMVKATYRRRHLGELRARRERPRNRRAAERIGVLMALAADDPEGQARIKVFEQGLNA